MMAVATQTMPYIAGKATVRIAPPSHKCDLRWDSVSIPGIQSGEACEEVAKPGIMKLEWPKTTAVVTDVAIKTFGAINS